MRRSGIPQVGDVPWGTDFCLFYDDRQDLFDFLVPYFQAGLEDNESCLWIASEPLDASTARAALARAVPDLDERLRGGQIEILDHAPTPETDAGGVLRGWVARHDAALARGYEGLRLSGNMCWLERSGWRDFAGYVEAVDALVSQHKMLALCAFSLAGCGAAEVMEIAANHEFALAKHGGRWETIRSVRRRNLQASVRQREEALRQREQRLTLATGAAGLGVLEWNTVTGQIIWENDRMYEILGCTRESGPFSFDQIWERALHPGDVPSVERAIQEAFASGRFHCQCRIRRQNDGAERWIEGSGRVEFAPDGSPCRLVGVVSDITGRKQAERNLAEAKSRQELLAEVLSRLLASDDPQTIVNDLARKVMERLQCQAFFNYLVEVPGKRLRLNACAGVSEDVARSLETLDFGAAVCGCVARDRRRIVAENIPENPDPRTDLLGSYGILAYACHPLLAGGRLLGTLAFGASTKSRFSEDDLDLMQTVSIHVAIALERAQAQQALRRSEAVYRGVACSVPDGAVAVVDRQLRYIVADGALFGRLFPPRENVEGRLLSEIDEAPALQQAAEDLYRRALDGDPCSREMEYLGRRVWGQYGPLRDESGQVLAAMSLWLDVTEQRRSEEQLRHAQKLESVGLLASGIAHDFNNLLVGVVGNASLAEDLLPYGSPAAEILRKIVSTGEQAASLTRQMLAYAGKGRFVIEPVSLAGIARDAGALLRSSIPKRIAIGFQLDPQTPSIESDPSQMQQILLNLVLNASEAIGSGSGAITVRTGALDLNAAAIARDLAGWPIEPGRHALLEVRDNGCGMDAATMARIFDPFFSTKFHGRGLGLAAVAGIVRAHKGAIQVVSAAGAGSTLRILLPAMALAAPIPQRRAEPAADLRGRGAVLVIDDEEMVREVAKRALQRQGYEVLLAGSGPAAIELLQGHRDRIRLAVLDLSMPGMSGEETLCHLRKIKPALHVIVSSGFAESETMRCFEGTPIAGFVQKPYTARELAAEVKAALA